MPPVHFGDGGLLNYLPRLASTQDPPYLSFPSSYDYKDEPPVPSNVITFDKNGMY
jgi:hypothetical protein